MERKGKGRERMDSWYCPEILVKTRKEPDESSRKRKRVGFIFPSRELATAAGTDDMLYLLYCTLLYLERRNHVLDNKVRYSNGQVQVMC